MNKPRSSRTKLSIRREAMPDDAAGRAKLVVRYGSRDALRHLQDPTRETAKWAREGVLTTTVLQSGNLTHLKTLVALGGRFDRILWSNTQRIEEWNTQATREWFEVMFENGWDGKGGRPQALLSVAEYHPELVDLWAQKAPKAWHTRRNWLDGALILNQDMTPEQVLAWMGVGATPHDPEKILYEQWIRDTKNEEGVVQLLMVIHDFMKSDKARRRVRGEPPFRDWPWGLIQQAAVEHSKIELAHWLGALHSPLSLDQVIELVARSPKPVQAMGRVKELGLKLPGPKDAKAGQFLSQAIVRQIPLKNTQQPKSEQFVFHLLEQGYKGPLSSEAVARVMECSDVLRSAIDAATLAQNTPQAAPVAPTRRRI